MVLSHLSNASDGQSHKDHAPWIMVMIVPKTQYAQTIPNTTKRSHLYVPCNRNFLGRIWSSLASSQRKHATGKISAALITCDMIAQVGVLLTSVKTAILYASKSPTTPM